MTKSFEYEYVSYEELCKAYLDCRKRKRTTANALDFEINENAKLYQLWYDLNSFNYEIDRSIVFCVDKPVKREVFAADFRDRIIHHLVINRIIDIVEKEFIDDSYSCRVGKGTDYGIKKCVQYLKESSYNYTQEYYIVKCDLKSFFMTIDKNRLENKLFKFIDEKYEYKDIRDLKFLKYLIHIIIFNEPQNNCIRKQPWEMWSDLPKEKSLFFCEKDKGLPIGNLTSQIFANFYLSEFDKYVKEFLMTEYYGRYVDDFFFVAKSKKEANTIIDMCKHYLSNIGVQLHPKKLYIQKIQKGVKFIGAVIKKDRIYIANRTKGSLWWKVKQFRDYLEDLHLRKEKLSYREIEHMVGSLNSYLGFLIHYNTYNIRKKIFLDYNFMKPIYKYCYIDKDLKKLTIFLDYKPYKSPKDKKRFDKATYFNKRIYKKLDFKKDNNNNKRKPVDI